MIVLFICAISISIAKNKKNMINLVVDAANDKIFFAIMTESKSYTTTHLNSRENFDKFMKLLIEFLKKNNTNLRNIDNILINQGPGKFSSIRISISIVKGISLANNINLIGFNSNDIKNQNYKNLLELSKKKLLIKERIKPQYND